MGGIRGVTRDLQVLATREDHEDVVLHTNAVLLRLEDLAEFAQTNAEAEMLQSFLDFQPEISLVSPRLELPSLPASCRLISLGSSDWGPSCCADYSQVRRDLRHETGNLGLLF